MRLHKEPSSRFSLFAVGNPPSPSSGVCGQANSTICVSIQPDNSRQFSQHYETHTGDRRVWIHLWDSRQADISQAAANKNPESIFLDWTAARGVTIQGSSRRSSFSRDKRRLMSPYIERWLPVTTESPLLDTRYCNAHRFLSRPAIHRHRSIWKLSSWRRIYLSLSTSSRLSPFCFHSKCMSCPCPLATNQHHRSALCLDDSHPIIQLIFDTHDIYPQRIYQEHIDRLSTQPGRST